MSYADQVFRANCLDILQNGVRDDGLTVRPHWEDGTPAHTIKKFGLVNRYDLQKEFPILTLRRTYLKSAVDELACFEAGDLGKHVDEHRVLTDVPVVGGEHVLRALIQDGVQRAV